MLCRGPDPHLVVFPGSRERRLALEVEVLLAADPHPALEPVRGGGDRGRRLAAQELVGGQHLGAGGETVVHGDARRDRLDVDAGTTRGAARLVAGLGDHREHHLSVKEDLAVGQDRIVSEGGAAIVRAGNVRGGQHRQHPGRGPHCVEIDGLDRPARRMSAAGRDVHRARRLREVVDVGGSPPNVSRGAVVGEGEPDARVFVEIRTIRERGVGDERARLHGRRSMTDANPHPATSRRSTSMPDSRPSLGHGDRWNGTRMCGPRTPAPDTGPAPRSVSAARRAAPAAPPRRRSRPAPPHPRPACGRSAPRRRRPRPRSEPE